MSNLQISNCIKNAARKKKKSRFLSRCGWDAKQILVCQNWGRAVMLRESPSQSSQLPVTGETRTSLKKTEFVQPGFERHPEGHGGDFHGAKQRYKA